VSALLLLLMLFPLPCTGRFKKHAYTRPAEEIYNVNISGGLGIFVTGGSTSA
jgi:hypothetical protein